MSGAWNDWYHCMGNTYGTWPPGDPRGFRARHHREHIDGDYKSPPPQGMYDERLQKSRGAMRRSPVVLSPQLRRLVCAAMGEKLLVLKVELVELCVTAVHFHLLARFSPLVNSEDPGMAMPGLSSANMLQDGRDPRPRHYVGLAKKHASHIVRQKRVGVEGGLWAARSLERPVMDRSHQLVVVRYIRAHEEHGGVVWSRLRGARV